MRLARSLAVATLGFLAMHCSSPEEREEPAKVIENRPGALVITSPARAAFVSNDRPTVTIKGTGATRALTIDGKSAKVDADGAFEATVTPAVGLNVVVAEDGESRLETSFLYGQFAPANQPVAKALAIEVGQVGIEAPVPAVSLTSVTNLALEGRNLIDAMKGKTIAGEASGATYSFTVTGGGHQSPKIMLNTANKGLGVTALVSSVLVEGDLTIEALGGKGTRPVRISVDRATVLAESEIGVDAETSALHVEVPSAEAYLDGFRFSSDNAGFPCCVDSIVTGVLQPKVQDAIRDGIREQVPSALALTLDGAGLPKEVDLSATGLPLVLGVATKLDTGAFDPRGGMMTASALFDGRFGVGSPGSKAPGWLALGGEPLDVAATKRTPSLGVSLALDAINQLFFAAWGSGSLAYTSPAPFEAKLAPALPPVVAITDAGALRLALGEVEVRRADSESPFAAASVIQDVKATASSDAIVLEPVGKPTISITWLADDNVGSGKNLVAIAAKEQLDKFLKPMRIPIPRIALDRLGGGFVGQSLAIAPSTISIDKKTARLGVTGAMHLAR